MALFNPKSSLIPRGDKSKFSSIIFLTLTVLLFMWTWNEFLLALIMIQDAEMRTAPLALSYFAGNKRYGDPAITAAAAIWVALPVLITYIFLQRRFISGMVTGAVKE